MPNEAAQPPCSALTVRCAWCGRIRVGDAWMAPAIDPDPETLTHGICPDCARRYGAESAFRS